MRTTSAKNLKNTLLLTFLTCSTFNIAHAAPRRAIETLKVSTNGTRRSKDKKTTLTAFNIIVQSNQTILSWSSIESESGNYLIYRSEDQVNYVKIGEKQINAKPSDPSLYIFHDESPIKGLNSYKLVQRDTDGKTKDIAVKDVFLGAKSSGLMTNMPSPKINRI